jgi:ankyrin repeat protein
MLYRKLRIREFVVAGAILIVSLSGYLFVRYHRQRMPRPDSAHFLVPFAWDGGVKSLRVVNPRTGEEERNKELRKMIALEAAQKLPTIIKLTGLQRAEGVLYCYLSGTGELYRPICLTYGEPPGASVYDPEARRPVMLAAEYGDAREIRELVSRGEQVNAHDQHGVTALMRAVRSQRMAVLEALTDAGADVNAKDFEGRTALSYAVDGQSVAAVGTLLAKGADANAADNSGRTALMVAAGSHDSEIVRALVTAGARVNATDKDGETALMQAAQFGTPAIFRMLLAAHADPCARSRDGYSAIDLAHSSLARPNDRVKIEALLKSSRACN